MAQLQLSPSLSNLLRTISYAHDTKLHRDKLQRGESSQERYHMCVTGWEHAGVEMEQTIWEPLLRMRDEAVISAPPLIFYAPLLVDWSGAKLSKTAYQNGAYQYMKDTGKEYLLSYGIMKKEGKEVETLFKIVQQWVDEPKKLFRPYSEECIHRQFQLLSNSNCHQDEANGGHNSVSGRYWDPRTWIN